MHASILMWLCPLDSGLIDTSPVLIVSFRGTVSLENWRTDFKVGRVVEKSLAEAAAKMAMKTGQTVEVHRGFSAGLDALDAHGLSGKLEALITETRAKMVWFVGHSL